MTCTLGPSSADADTIQNLSDSGMSIARLNFSHVPAGQYAYPASIIENVRAAKGMHCKVLNRDYNMLAVMLDTKGPEIRTGVVEGYVQGSENLYVDFVDGAEVTVTTRLSEKNKVTAESLYIDYEAIGTTVTPGHVLLLDDGLIGLEVVRVDAHKLDDEGKEYCEISCTVSNGGSLGSVKGVNIPNTVLQLPSMTQKDKDDMEWGVRSNEIDIVAASFVRKGGDVRSVKAHLERCIQKAKADGALAGPVVRPWVISKIENKEGVDNFTDILEESDGIMVARGDLGVEVPFEKVRVGRAVVGERRAGGSLCSSWFLFLFPLPSSLFPLLLFSLSPPSFLPKKPPHPLPPPPPLPAPDPPEAHGPRVQPRRQARNSSHPNARLHAEKPPPDPCRGHRRRQCRSRRG